MHTLTTVAIDGAGEGELRGYATEDCERFIYTMGLVPEGPQKALEIGANPYFTTLLIKKFRPFTDLQLTNYFGGRRHSAYQTVTWKNFEGNRESHKLLYLNLNIEEKKMPFAGGQFDVILFCEVIEHLTNDPLHSLLQINRVLKNDGLLILTTPNVARLENVARLMAGSNIYDPYSGYGLFGRHNREYTRHELFRLLTHCGFSEDVVFTADVHDNRAEAFFPVEKLARLLEFRRFDLGQYLISR